MGRIRKVLNKIGKGFKKVKKPPPPTYDNLPMEIKMEIINMLGSEGRSNMSQVSRLSETLCKTSPYFLQYLNFRSSTSIPAIFVGHSMNHTDYRLNFEKNEMICSKSDEGKELWREKVGNSRKEANLNCCRQFEKLLHEHQNSIRSLHIRPYAAETFDIDVEKLPRLERLQITTDNGISYGKIFWKLTKPLDTLIINQGYNSRVDYRVLQYEQIYHAHNRIVFNKLRLKYENLIKLTAKNVEMELGRLTEKNIADWLKLYQNGEWKHSIIYYMIFVGERDFDCEKLWKLLGSSEKNFEKLLAIRNSTNRRKLMYLQFEGGYLRLKNLTG